jgi:hypothetical protein
LYIHRDNQSVTERHKKTVSINDISLYSIDMPPILRFCDIASGKPFHAVLIHLLRGNNEYSQEHRHDFWEISYSLSSHGINSVNGVNYNAVKGSLSLIRPQDIHAVSSQGDWKFVNVAFSAKTFRVWCELSGLQQELAAWEKGDELLCYELPPYGQPAFDAIFRRMASLFGAAQSSARNFDCRRRRTWLWN